ncbi:MAG: tetratricopeptide repeat protein [Planctomycetia bacterium]|nr:tetratricopeptide repeat protein [Planctomycetia bacterium]
MSQKKFNSSHSKSSSAGSASSESSAERSVKNQNIRGVHLMREGNIDEAVCILRSIVMPPGCTWSRPDAPNVFRRNFATALLLAGHPSGCLELLAEMRDEQNPRVQQLRAAIKRWEKTLSFFQWLNWRTGWIEPANRPVTLDFVPGELEGESPRSGTTPTSSAASPLTTAV